MATILSIPDIIELGKISTYLSTNYVEKGKLFGGTVIKPQPPVLITMSWYALEWGYDNNSGAQTDASLRDTANYCYWLYGKFQLEAQRISGGSGGGSVIPTPSGGSLPNPYDWIIAATTTSDAPLKDGDTTVTLDGTNGTRDFRGFNIEFTRNNITQYTTPPVDGFSTYYSWDRTTGIFAVLNGAAVTGEQFRIYPST